MLRLTFAFFLAAVASVVSYAQGGGGQGLVGKVEGRTYISPTGAFKVTVPVLAELGGEITDTPNVVTFQDDFNVHVSIAAFQQDATQRWEMSTRGTKDYLIYFFSNFVLRDFKQSFEGVQMESAKFLPGTLDGTLLTYFLVPGGTMFRDRLPIVSGQLPVAKRGNYVFVRSGYVFVISIELAERVVEGRLYSKTTAEEDDILRNRLTDIVSKMSFVKPPTADTAKK